MLLSEDSDSDEELRDFRPGEGFLLFGDTTGSTAGGAGTLAGRGSSISSIFTGGGGVTVWRLASTARS